MKKQVFFDLKFHRVDIIIGNVLVAEAQVKLN